MDKTKTGNLIKNARTKKNYTQSELGNLLGVSNKAVSRWENGDSFPDVGILENLAAVLDLQLQDIITGGTETNDASVVAEVVQVARLQQKEKKRRAIRNCSFFIAMSCCIISGISALGSHSILEMNNSIIIYIMLMVFSFVFLFVGYTLQNEAGQNDTHHDYYFYKCMKFVSLFSFAYMIFLIWCVFLMSFNGHLPFGMKVSSAGLFINRQLISLFAVNFIVIVLDWYQCGKKNTQLHRECYISTAVMYAAVLYGDLLHRMSSVQEAMELLTKRTLIIFAAVVISLTMAKLLQPKQPFQ